MTDVLTPGQRSFNMSRIRGTDTQPEMRVRRLLHSMGLRYRLHGKALPGKPDLVFAGARAVVFVHGCFWHMHECALGKPVPATNQDFWAEKRRGNALRDTRNRAALKALGWRVFEIWECETRDDKKLLAKARKVATRIATPLGATLRELPRAATTPTPARSHPQRIASPLRDRGK